MELCKDIRPYEGLAPFSGSLFTRDMMGLDWYPQSLKYKTVCEVIGWFFWLCMLKLSTTSEHFVLDE